MNTFQLYPGEIVVDSFAGGGGASTGVEMALKRSPDIAINHDEEAIAMHAVNHPTTQHYTSDVWKIDPIEVCAGRKVGLAWFSPDCKHFSKAKGGKPVDKTVRGLAWVVVRWAKTVKPRMLFLENVEEFQTWGPLLDDGTPCPARKGLTFRRWIAQLRACGYVVEWKELRACDYGAPTSRKRLFVIARCDGQPIAWPQPTHGPAGSGLLPYRTAADCIDWSLPCHSIFLSKAQGKKFGIRRPLAPNTMRRIARGLKRYVIDSPKPFIIPLTHTGDSRVHDIDEPMRTITGAHRGEHALVTPFVSTYYGGERGAERGNSVDEPLHTQPTANRHALIAPTLIQTSYGERKGQAPRTLDLHEPLGTVVAGGVKHSLVYSQLEKVAAFIAKHNGGNEATGQKVTAPVDAITCRDSKSLVTSTLVKLRGTSTAADVEAPVPTLTAGGTHVAEVRAFLIKYYGQDQDPRLEDPMHTVTTKPRFGLVMVHGEEYAIVDVGMRMLVPRELYRAQGFPDSYVIDFTYLGEPLSKGAQVRMCGNSVPPPMACALIQANTAEQRIAAVA